MRSILEFTMGDLISTQILIGETFDKLHYQIENDLAELSELREVYTQKSIDALNLLWKNFEDNNFLLIEAQVKEDNYFTANIFKKVKEEYLSAKSCFINAELPQETSLGKPCADLKREKLISYQLRRFKTMGDEIQGIRVDYIREIIAMENWQKILKRLWTFIEKHHKYIRDTYVAMWPELTYELRYLQYKNMYETTYSLFNYKIDAVLNPIVHVIPHIGIPTWRMFDNLSEFHPFALTSVAWGNFRKLNDLVLNNTSLEGQRRQLLISAFLVYQTRHQSQNPDESNEEIEDQDPDESNEEIEHQESDESNEEIEDQDSDESNEEIEDQDSDESNEEIEDQDPDESNEEIEDQNIRDGYQQPWRLPLEID